jgi:NADH dehydrogenase
MDERSSKQRIVVVGGGFAGLTFVGTLKAGAAEITLIDQRNHHLFQPLLYQVATASLTPSDIAWPIRHVLRKRRDVRTLLGSVTGVETARRVVRLADGGEIPYDTLVLATGARHSYFGHDDWEPFATGLKTVEDATAARLPMVARLPRSP